MSTERRNYRKLYSRLWRHAGFLGLNDADRVLAIYMLTGPQANRAGLFRFSAGAAADDLERDTEAIRYGIAKVCDTFAWEYDGPTKTLWIPTWWEYNEPDNPKHLIGALSDLNSLPRTPLAAKFCAQLEHIPEALRHHVMQWRERLAPTQEVSSTVSEVPGAESNDHIAIPYPIPYRKPYAKPDRNTVPNLTVPNLTVPNTTEPPAALTTAAEKRTKPKAPPVLQTSRFSVWQWQYERMMAIVGDPVAFNLSRWLRRVSDEETAVLDMTPRQLLEHYLLPKLRHEIRARGLTVAKAVVESPLAVTVSQQATGCRHRPPCATAAQCGQRTRDALKVWEQPPSSASGDRSTR